MDEALKQADKDISTLLATYAAWSGKFEHGAVHYATYDDLIEFVNARMETVESCQLLLANERVADALGMCRSLLENYLLFILVCRGKKYFRYRSMKGKSEAEIKQVLKDEQKHVGKNNLLAVEKHPKLDKQLLYIFEGVKSSDQPDYNIPFHYFTFKDFNPDTMRLDDDKYFKYHHQMSESLKEKRKQWKAEQTYLYRNYLSYDALLHGLKLNDIADDADIARIEAHYTYLGKFLHPTNRTFQELRERSNYHSSKTLVGFEYPYERAALLMAYCYTIHNAISLVAELAGVFDSAPKDYLKSSGSANIRKLVSELEERYSYFWYIFNEPSDWDKFNYVIHHVNDEEFKAIGNDYRKVDPKIVTFQSSIYRRFTSALGGWSNTRVGRYRSPVQ